MKFCQIKKLHVGLGVFTLLFLLSTSSEAAGFFFPFQSASGLGTFYAGGSAIADDASTVFENSAGMVRLEQPQLVLSGVLLDVSAIFSGTGITALPAPGFPKTANAQGGDSGIIPLFIFPRRYLKN